MLTAVATLMLMLAVWTVYALAALPLLLPFLGGEAYTRAAPLVAPLAMSFVIGGLATVLASRYFHNGQTWWISVCCLLGLGLNLLLCLLNPTLQGTTTGLLAGSMMTCMWLGLGLLPRR